MQRKLNTPFKTSPVTMHQIEVITSVERRRRWSREEKERLDAATVMPEARVSEIARTAGIHVSQLFRWRKELCQISAAVRPAAHSGRDRRAAFVASGAAGLPTAQKGKYRHDRAWPRPSPAGRE
ncbi:hypothetical protein CN934_18110 [Ensifer sp. MMN_5]|nr:hypothetical protein CN934_18110 [Ensifer sp. MMN_5]